jgi:hypothetical protein
MTTTYLGMTRRTAAAVAATAAAAGFALGMILPAPDAAPCGYVMEGAEMVPASCITEADLQARLDAIRVERSGGRW